MRLGTSSPLKHATPEEWADNAGLSVAEVGIWRNALSMDPDEQKRL